MFTSFPLEITEKILLYLSFTDILSTFSAFNKQYNILPDYFWKTVCLRDDFHQAYETQQWYESFQSGVNKKLGYYIHLKQVPNGTLKHVYLRSLIICDIDESVTSTYKVYFLDDHNSFNLTQIITEDTVLFRKEFILVQRLSQCIVYLYNHDLNRYDLYKTFTESVNCVFGISNKYCAVNRYGEKWLYVYFLDTDDIQTVILPRDVKFLIEKVLHENSLVVSALTFTEGYKIKVYDILSQSWTLDLFCFGSTGITNDPNVWVGSNFIGCCNITYRLHGNYFGPFKVWNKRGSKIFQADIEPSTKHYIRCFFKEEHIILTTSDNTISIFNNMGENISKFHMSTSFLDIRMSSGYLIFLLLEEKDTIEIYDWSASSYLYSVKLNNKCGKSLYSSFLYCPICIEGSNFEVVKFY